MIFYQIIFVINRDYFFISFKIINWMIIHIIEHLHSRNLRASICAALLQILDTKENEQDTKSLIRHLQRLIITQTQKYQF